MLAIHKHSDSQYHPAFNAMGHLGSFACVVLLFFGHRIFPGNLVTLFVPLAMGANAFVYLLWFLTSKKTALLIPTVFWSLLGVIVLFGGFPAWQGIARPF